MIGISSAIEDDFFKLVERIEVTQEPFIVYTSHTFAILGLRAFYFALSAMIHRFSYLKYALALILVFIGGKIFLVSIIGKIPAVISLSVPWGCCWVGCCRHCGKPATKPLLARRSKSKKVAAASGRLRDVVVRWLASTRALMLKATVNLSYDASNRLMSGRASHRKLTAVACDGGS